MSLFSKRNKDIEDDMGYLDAEELLEMLLTDYTSAAKNNVLSKMRQGSISKQNFLDDAREHLRSHYHPTESMLRKGMDLFEQYVFGYYILTDLIEHSDISDIRCISYDNIRIKINGKRCNSGVAFKSKEAYYRFVNFVAVKNQVDISNLNAIQKFTDDKTSDKFVLRFTVTMPIVNIFDEPYLCIRKVPKDFPEIDALIEKDMLSSDLAALLVKRFKEGSTLICGGNSSGKTTLLNALKETLPDDMAVLISQQADELRNKLHPDTMLLHSLPPTAESTVSYDLEDISLAGLTMDVDFFIVGEVKGAEAAYLLNAAYTGQMAAATVHSPGAKEGPEKIVDYALHSSKYTRAELMKMMECFKTIIFMKSFKVSEVLGTVGWNPEKEEIEYECLYKQG